MRVSTVGMAEAGSMHVRGVSLKISLRITYLFLLRLICFCCQRVNRTVFAILKRRSLTGQFLLIQRVINNQSTDLFCRCAIISSDSNLYDSFAQYLDDFLRQFSHYLY